MVITINTLKQTEVIKGFRGRFLHTENFTLAYWEIEPNSVLPEHSHVHEQTTQVIEGELELTINGKTFILKPGMIASIPSHVVHSGKALTKCVVTDTFYPKRTDYFFD